jgi:hypothetical protein
MKISPELNLESYKSYISYDVCSDSSLIKRGKEMNIEMDLDKL